VVGRNLHSTNFSAASFLGRILQERILNVELCFRSGREETRGKTQRWINNDQIHNDEKIKCKRMKERLEDGDRAQAGGI
jgi:hypothetical protein